MFINVRPIQKEPIKWPWKNRIVNGYPFVVESPGEVKMPDLIEPFNWRSYDYLGTNCKPIFGTQDMKSVFTTYTRFMGVERALVDIIDGVAWDCLVQITKGFATWNRKLLGNHSKINNFMIGDDIAFNGGLLMSPDLIRECLLPHWKSLYAVAKEWNIPNLIFHSDGDITPILLDLAGLGVTTILYEPIGLMRFIKPNDIIHNILFIPAEHHDNEPFAGYMPEGEHV